MCRNRSENQKIFACGGLPAEKLALILLSLIIVGCENSTGYGNGDEIEAKKINTVYYYLSPNSPMH